MESDDESHHKRTSCCGFFWGPYRPLFGGHAMFEASTSAILPTVAVFLYRATFSVFLLSTLVYFAAKGRYSFMFFSAWAHLGLALSFSLSTAVTFAFLITPQKYDSLRPSTLASASILLFQVFASAAVFLDLVFWTLLFGYDETPDFAILVQHAANLICVLLDILLSLRMQFKLIYAATFVLFTIFYLCFMWVRYAINKQFVYDVLDYRLHSKGVTVGYYLGIIAWGVIASVLMVLLSRLNRLPCVPGRYSRANLVQIDDSRDDIAVSDTV